MWYAYDIAVDRDLLKFKREMINTITSDMKRSENMRLRGRKRNREREQARTTNEWHTLNRGTNNYRNTSLYEEKVFTT